jgi:hypothetical protein
MRVRLTDQLAEYIHNSYPQTPSCAGAVIDVSDADASILIDKGWAEALPVETADDGGADLESTVDDDKKTQQR